MKRPTGWKANPQAMVLGYKRQEYTGHPDLVSPVDGDTWLTPRWILDRLGTFDLDPCAAASNPHWVCDSAFTVREDGMNTSWGGRVFMNPPFSNAAPWIRRHAEHAVICSKAGISLVAASVESKVWREVVWTQANAVLLLHGRTRFCNPDGSTTQGRPLRSIALIAWSPDDAEVLRDSGLAGVFLDSWRQV